MQDIEMADQTMPHANLGHENGEPMCALRELIMVDFLFATTEIYSLAHMSPPPICHRMKSFTLERSFKRWY